MRRRHVLAYRRYGHLVACQYGRCHLRIAIPTFLRSCSPPPSLHAASCVRSRHHWRWPVPLAAVPTDATSPWRRVPTRNSGSEQGRGRLPAEVVAAAKATSLMAETGSTTATMASVSPASASVAPRSQRTVWARQGNQAQPTDITLSTPHVHFSVWDKILGSRSAAAVPSGQYVQRLS